MARILLIDDDNALLDMLSLSLEDAGHEVEIADDGLTGLERFRTWSPEIVVSDINMPRLDGFSFCRQLREAGESVPLILLTSRDSEIDEALGLELGADDYVTKPFRMRVLLARVNALVRRESLRASPAETQASNVTRIGELELAQRRLVPGATL